MRRSRGKNRSRGRQANKPVFVQEVSTSNESFYRARPRQNLMLPKQFVPPSDCRIQNVIKRSEWVTVFQGVSPADTTTITAFDVKVSDVAKSLPLSVRGKFQVHSLILYYNVHDASKPGAQASYLNTWTIDGQDFTGQTRSTQNTGQQFGAEEVALGVTRAEMSSYVVYGNNPAPETVLIKTAGVHWTAILVSCFAYVTLQDNVLVPGIPSRYVKGLPRRKEAGSFELVDVKDARCVFDERLGSHDHDPCGCCRTTSS